MKCLGMDIGLAAAVLGLFLIAGCSSDDGYSHIQPEQSDCIDNYAPTINWTGVQTVGDYYRIRLRGWDDCCIRHITVKVEKNSRTVFDEKHDFLTCTTFSTNAYANILAASLDSGGKAYLTTVITDHKDKTDVLKCTLSKEQGKLKLEC